MNEDKPVAAPADGFDEYPGEVETEAQEAAYAAWMRSKVQEADDDSRPGIAHDAVMAKAMALVAELKAQHLQKASV